MKTNNQKANFLSRIYCSFFGHNYMVTKKITYHVKEYTCCKCKKQLTTDSNGNLIELTPKHKEINTILKRIHINKIRRLKRKTVASPIYQRYLKSS